MVEKEACLEKASVAAEGHRAEAARRGAEFVGLRRVLEDVEAGHSAENGEGSKLGRGLAGEEKLYTSTYIFWVWLLLYINARYSKASPISVLALLVCVRWTNG